MLVALTAGLPAFAWGLPALAAETPPAAPLWVPVPTRIDRDNQTRERIVEPARAPDDRLYLRVAPVGPHFDALTFLSDDGRVVRLAGIETYERSRICTVPAGGRWACGLRASMALKTWIAGRVVACRERPGAGPVEIRPPGAREAIRALAADCSLGDRSLAERLVAEGWATPIDPADPTLAPAAARARTARLGIWREQLPD